MYRSPNPEIDEVIANGRRLAAEATELLQEVEQFFAERNITPDSVMDDLRKRGGQEAVDYVMAQVEQETRKIEDEVAQRRLYLSKKRAPGRRVSTRMKI